MYQLNISLFGTEILNEISMVSGVYFSVGLIGTVKSVTFCTVATRTPSTNGNEGNWDGRYALEGKTSGSNY